MERIKITLSGNDADLLNDVLFDIDNYNIQKIRLKLVKAIGSHKIRSVRK